MTVPGRFCDPPYLHANAVMLRLAVWGRTRAIIRNLRARHTASPFYLVWSFPLPLRGFAQCAGNRPYLALCVTCLQQLP